MIHLLSRAQQNEGSAAKHRSNCNLGIYAYVPA